jgi:hypothetical protein
MKWVGYVACMDMRIVATRSQGNMLRSRWEDIKMDHREIRYDCVNYTEPAKERLS